MVSAVRNSKMKEVPLSEVKDDLSRFLREAETQDVIITRHGKPAGVLIGFVTIDATGYLDQLVVAADHWGSALANTLVDEAKRLSPHRITLLVNTDNARAIRFYERNGFAHAGEDVNPTSGRPVLRMEWKG